MYTVIILILINNNLEFSNNKCGILDNLRTNSNARTQENPLVTLEGDVVLAGLLKAQIQAAVGAISRGH